MDIVAEVMQEILRAVRRDLANLQDAGLEDPAEIRLEVMRRVGAFTAQELLDDRTRFMWDPSWSGTRCPSCGHLHPTTAERVSTVSRTCEACGLPMRMYALEDLWAKADTPRLLHDVPDGELQSVCARLGQIWSVDPASLVGDPFDRSRALALLEVWESVGDLNQVEEDTRAWPRQTLSAPGFDGRTPMQVMQTGLTGLLLVRDFLRDVLQRGGCLAGRRPIKGDLVFIMSRLLEVPVEVLLPVLDLVERTTGPSEVLDEIRSYLGLTVPAGKGWDNLAKFPSFQDVVEKTTIARITYRAVDEANRVVFSFLNSWVIRVMGKGSVALPVRPLEGPQVPRGTLASRTVQATNLQIFHEMHRISVATLPHSVPN